MQTMNSATVIPIEGARERGRRVARAVDARRRLDNRPRDRQRTRGRAWLNGIELGAPSGAFAHLARSYD